MNQLPFHDMYFLPQRDQVSFLRSTMKIRLSLKTIQRKIVNIFLLIILACVYGAQKNHLIETVLLSAHNICFGLEIRVIFLLNYLS